MQDGAALGRMLADMDGQGYGSYKRIRGRYGLGRFRLDIDSVQADPFAAPSKMRISLTRDQARIPDELLDDQPGRTAVGDFLTRRFAEHARAVVARAGNADGGRRGGAENRGGGSRGPGGSGNSGRLEIDTPGQQVIERTSLLITEDRVEARIEVGLPAAGRRVRGRDAAQLLTKLLPRIAEDSLRHKSLDAEALHDHVTLHRDQAALRGRLVPAGLIAFVADGANLPRRSGDSDLPMESGAVPFTAPDSLRVSFELPSGRTVTGMGLPEGISVIVGGGYHGKSTLLRAIERGVYSHIPGDGREWVITRPDAMTVRAEDGRAVTGVDISPFITNLPAGTDTRRFSTTNASGSTSQAANLVEAIESGSTALVIDEDTSATNFMIRDERMRELISADREPITPLIDRIRALYTERGVSTVLVAGGSGAFFDVADRVIALDEYRPIDVTADARRIAGIEEPAPGSGPVPDPDRTRVPTPTALNPRGKDRPAKSRGLSQIQFGRDTIDLAAVAQLVDPAQTQALARVLDRLAEEADGERSLVELIAEVNRRIDERGLDWLSPFAGHPGQLARPRAQEIHAAVNRYRELKLATSGE